MTTIKHAPGWHIDTVRGFGGEETTSDMTVIRDKFWRHRRRQVAIRSSCAFAIAIIMLIANAIAGSVAQGGNVMSAPQFVTANSAVAEEKELIAAFDRAVVALSRTLLTWIGHETDYPVDALLADPPAFVFALVGDTLDFNGAELPVTATLHGAYVRASDAVVLVLPWHIDSLDDRSVLLHELVHAAQLSARDWRCLDETEWEAYQLQRRWLAASGIDLQLDWILIGILSHCTDTSL